MRTRRFLTCFWLVCLTSGCFHTVRFDLKSSHEAPAEGVNKVIVETRNGRANLVCRTAPGPVRVQATRKGRGSTEAAARECAEAMTIQVERDTLDPATLRIAMVAPPEPKWGWSHGASFDVELPQGVDVDVQTSSGAVTVRGARGDLKLKTSNGAIAVADVQGDMDVQTSNARIELAGVEGGRIHASTSNGSIEAHDISGEPSLRTSNGRIRLHLDRTPGRPRIRVVSSNGEIELEVPGTVEADLNLRTSNGSITHDLGGFDAVHGVKSSRDRFQATLNGGGGSIEGETSNGRVSFRSRR